MSAPQVSRRSVARGAAWSVPLVAVGVAAPAFAASGSPIQVTTVSVCQCEGGGVKKYAITVTFSNSTTNPVNLTGIQVLEGGAAILNQSATSGTVNAGPATTQLTFYFNRQSNGATAVFGVNYTPTGSPVQDYTTPSAISATGDCLTACP